MLGMTVDARAGETLTANRLNGRFQSQVTLYNLWFNLMNNSCNRSWLCRTSLEACNKMITGPHTEVIMPRSQKLPPSLLSFPEGVFEVVEKVAGTIWR